MSKEDKAIKDLKEDMSRCIHLSHYSDDICNDWVGICALRKQIPQKAVTLNVMDNPAYICPCCHQILTSLADEKPKYCIQCGQALEWEEDG